MLNRPGEAESSPRRALQLDPGYIEAQYMLGMALVLEN
jgi:hypothetical protein